MSHSNQKEEEEQMQPIATFILKTYAILAQPDNAQIISWNSEGNSFLIKNIGRFTKETLPRHFRHHRYQSFIRQVRNVVMQLNMYSFSKVRMVQGSCFANQFFFRGRDSLLRFIKRKPERKKGKESQEFIRIKHKENRENRENKENMIKISSLQELPVKTRDRIEEQGFQPLPQVQNQVISVTLPPPLNKHVSFAAQIRPEGDQNFSGMMEPSSKWIANKEESCWHNFKSFKSFRPSIKFLTFEEEQSNQQWEQPRPRRLKSKTSLVGLATQKDI